MKEPTYKKIRGAEPLRSSGSAPHFVPIGLSIGMASLSSAPALADSKLNGSISIGGYLLCFDK